MSGRKDWCKHYRAMYGNDTCNAGVAFATLNLREIGHANCPCWNRKPEMCSLALYRTPEEIEAEEREMAERVNKTARARKAIVDQLGGSWKRGTPGASGVIDCPACGGKESLSFSRSGYNGHIHAGCKTEGCVRWME